MRNLTIDQPCSKESVIAQSLNYYKKRLPNTQYQFKETDSSYLLNIWGDPQRRSAEIEVSKSDCRILKNIYSQ